MIPAELRELYQEIILDHNKKPRNFKKPDSANREAEGFNPLCGDHYTIFLTVDGDQVREFGFTGTGCAISKASASVMGQLIKGKSAEEAKQLFEQFRAMVTGEKSGGVDELGKMAAFAGVSEFPARVKCAILPWHTMASALEGKDAPVSTE